MLYLNIIILVVAILLLAALFFWRRLLGSCWTNLWNWVSGIAPEISRQKLVALISVVGSIIAVGATWLWLANFTEPSAEPKSQFVIASVWLVVAIIQLLIPSDPEWEIIHAKRARHDQEFLLRAYNKLREERSDFEQIMSKKRYSSPAHRKAVEVDSFNLLLPEIQALCSYRKFKRQAEAIAAEIERNLAITVKDVERLIILLNQIEPKLKNEIERLGKVSRGLA